MMFAVDDIDDTVVRLLRPRRPLRSVEQYQVRIGCAICAPPEGFIIALAEEFYAAAEMRWRGVRISASR